MVAHVITRLEGERVVVDAQTKHGHRAAIRLDPRAALTLADELSLAAHIIERHQATHNERGRP